MFRLVIFSEGRVPNPYRRPSLTLSEEKGFLRLGFGSPRDEMMDFHQSRRPGVTSSFSINKRQPTGLTSESGTNLFRCSATSTPVSPPASSYAGSWLGPNIKFPALSNDRSLLGKTRLLKIAAQKTLPRLLKLLLPSQRRLYSSKNGSSRVGRICGIKWLALIDKSLPDGTACGMFREPPWSSETAC